MKKALFYIDRQSKTTKEEKVFGSFLLRILYPKNILLSIFIAPIRFLITHFSFVSKLYGKKMRRSRSKKKIQDFVSTYNVNLSEFDPIESYESFDAFFTRKLIKNRELPKDKKMAIIPADGRYKFFEKLSLDRTFDIKGDSFQLENFLQSTTLAEQFQGGTLVLGRLAPMDYHRFHFPFDAKVEEAKYIEGALYSVNPLTSLSNAKLFTQNRRMITRMQSKYFGEVVYVEIGATCVGLIHQTYQPGEVKKGDEKGYFSFGASAIALLFKKNSIQIDKDLLELSKSEEVFTKFGESLGKIGR